MLNSNLYKKLKTKMVWETVPPMNSFIPVPEWIPTDLPDLWDTSSLLSPISYYHRFIDENLLAHVVEQSNLYYAQNHGGKADLKLDIAKLEFF